MSGQGDMTHGGTHAKYALVRAAIAGPKPCSLSQTQAAAPVVAAAAAYAGTLPPAGAARANAEAERRDHPRGPYVLQPTARPSGGS